jgi:uncharacterized membrane protein YcaP (DUF421 family)
MYATAIFGITPAALNRIYCPRSKAGMASFPSFFIKIANQLLGLDVPPASMTFGQMAARSIVVFIFSVVIVRLGDRRLLGKHAGFDVLLVVVLGSVLSRGINGQAAFFPTLGACGLLVYLHHLMAKLAFKSDWFSRLIKGQPLTVVTDTKIVQQALVRANITRDDLDESLRLNGNVSNLGRIEEARLERNGNISVVQNGGS